MVWATFWLGQPANELSGGESQRLRLATELAKGARAKESCSLLDEPTTGLHYSDVKLLVTALNKLVDDGHMVVIVEHNLDIIKSADHIIDIGPEGGEGGGNIPFEGRPKMLAKITQLGDASQTQTDFFSEAFEEDRI